MFNKDKLRKYQTDNADVETTSYFCIVDHLFSYGRKGIKSFFRENLNAILITVIFHMVVLIIMVFSKVDALKNEEHQEERKKKREPSFLRYVHCILSEPPLTGKVSMEMTMDSSSCQDTHGRKIHIGWKLKKAGG